MNRAITIKKIRYHLLIKQSTGFICGWIAFILIVITVATCVVYFQLQKTQKKICEFTYEIELLNLLGSDSRPSSLALGYLNKDTDLDIVVVNSGIDSIQLYFGNGNKSFALKGSLSTGYQSKPIALAINYINGDTFLDIIVVNYESHNLAVFLGYGDGNYFDPIFFSTGSTRPHAIAMGDFNGDHYIDVSIVSPDTNAILINLGNGIGSFEYLTSYWTGYDSFPYSIVADHLNSDNRLDMIVINLVTNQILILMGVGDGTFTIRTLHSNVHNARLSSVGISDLNNDGQLDIVVANCGIDNIMIFLGYGNGSFSHGIIQYVVSGSHPQSIIISDFNNDERADIALANSGTKSVSVLLGYGNGSFAKESIFPTGVASNPFSLVTADFNRDDKVDIAIINQGDNILQFFYGYSLVPFDATIQFQSDDLSFLIDAVVGDFNNDSNLDIAIIFHTNNTIDVLLGNGHGNFTSEITNGDESSLFRSSLAVADLNNDQRLDIVVTNSGSHSFGVFLGYGNGSFAEEITYTIQYDSDPKSVVLADLNNDRATDIVIANDVSNNIGIFLGFGNGTFLNRGFYSTGENSRPHSVAVSDFNDDHQLDIVVCNSGTNTIGILFGSANEMFSNIKTYSTGRGSFPISIALADLNVDNTIDIVVANYGRNNVGIFLGYLNGTFASMVIYSTGIDSRPKAIAIADFNNDKHFDIFVANSMSASIGLFIGYGDGTFSLQTEYSMELSSLNSIAVGDFNNDDQLDTVIGVNDRPGLYVLMGHYHVEYQDRITYSTGAGLHPSSISIVDLDHNNEAEIIVTNFGTNTIDIHCRLANGTWQRSSSYPTGRGPKHMIVTDFDDDNRIDVAIANSIDDSITVLLEYDNFTFQRVSNLFSIERGSRPISIAVADLNNDQQLDLAVANQGTNTIGIYFGFDDITFERLIISSTETNTFPKSIAIADLNNDSELDLILVNENIHNVNVLLGNGNGTFKMMREYSTGDLSYPVCVSIGDFNEDSIVDFVVVNSDAYNLGIFLGYGNATFSMPTFYSTGSNSRPNSAVAHDLNNDGRLDIVVANQWTGNIGILFGQGNGRFRSIIFHSTGTDSTPSSIAIGEFNNDNWPDIAIANKDTSKMCILIGLGNGEFRKFISYPSGTNHSPHSIAVNDLNGDNQLDVVLADYFNDGIQIFHGLGNGTFGLLEFLSTGDASGPLSTAIIDVNGDRQLDIVVTLSGKSQFGIFFAYDNNKFVPFKKYSENSYSEVIGIVISDLNHDGQFDIVVTESDTDSLNIYLGSRKRNFLKETLVMVGDYSRPCSIAIFDSNNDNQSDIAVVKFQTNTIGILLGRGDGTFEKIMDYFTGEFSFPYAIGIGDLNNDNRSDIVVTNTGTNNLGVLFGQINGTFSIIHTYAISNDSNLTSIALSDLDNDTNLDIVVADQDTNKIFILVGNGNGSLQLAKSYSMEFNAHPSSVAIGDLNKDNQVDIVVSNYDTHALVLLFQICEF